MLSFSKANKASARLRLALIGPAGAGKTMTALKIATGLGQRIAVVDSERGSASKYASLFDFDVLELETFSPQQYIEAIHAAEAGGYNVLIIDSLSHAWTGKGGALEMVDNAAKRSQSGNTFGAWRDVTPLHNAMVDAIITARLHVIITMRAKTEYVQERDKNGRTGVRKVGLAPVQREGLEYETDVVCDLDTENNLIVGKTRCPALSGQVFHKAGADIAAILCEWLAEGAATAPAAVVAITQQELDDYEALRKQIVTQGGTPPGTLSLASKRSSLNARIKVAGDQIKELEAQPVADADALRQYAELRELALGMDYKQPDGQPPAALPQGVSAAVCAQAIADLEAAMQALEDAQCAPAAVPA